MAKAAKPAPRKTAAKAANGGKNPDDKAPSISEGKASGAVNLQVPPPQPGAQPSMRILGQYLKDDAKATSDGKVMFASELLFAGVFRMENFPANMLHAAVLIECPRMLFPFARQILADATRNGGFPPLMLDPIDFAGMYQKRMQQQKPAAQA